MNSSRPYLIRAIYEWIVDNDATPHMLIDTTIEGVVVPTEYIENNKIILNVGPMAANHLELGNDHIEFAARFAGKAMTVHVPTSAVLAVYARENGQGMVFSNDEVPADENKGGANASHVKKASTSKKPALRVVK